MTGALTKKNRARLVDWLIVGLVVIVSVLIVTVAFSQPWFMDPFTFRYADEQTSWWVRLAQVAVILTFYLIVGLMVFAAWLFVATRRIVESFLDSAADAITKPFKVAAHGIQNWINKGS
ncbi:MAG: hypothetical protein WAV04_03885 [Candidatus Microsaccharimonas sp.]